jgi:hypothetical protein
MSEVTEEWNMYKITNKTTVKISVSVQHYKILQQMGKSRLQWLMNKDK